MKATRFSDCYRRAKHLMATMNPPGTGFLEICFNCPAMAFYGLGSYALIFQVIMAVQ